MIEFVNVSKIYHSSKKPVAALRNISFQIKKGEFLSVVGRSGAGKTTMIRLLIADENPSSGKILFNKNNIEQMSKSNIQLLRREIGVVYQDYKLLSSKNVRENVEYVMEVINASDKEIKRDVPQILELVGLSERLGSFPEELSGGEKQRLAIARALCHRPQVIVADEPTGNLDLYNAYSIINLLKKIHRLGTTLILATHNKEVVDNLDRRVITLEEGKIVSDEQKGKFIL